MHDGDYSVRCLHAIDTNTCTYPHNLGSDLISIQYQFGFGQDLNVFILVVNFYLDIDKSQSDTWR